MNFKVYSRSASSGAPLSVEGAEVIFDEKVTLFPVQLEEIRQPGEMLAPAVRRNTAMSAARARWKRK